MPAFLPLFRRARRYGTHQQRLPDIFSSCLMRCETADCVMHSFLPRAQILVHVSPHPVPVMFCVRAFHCCCLLLVNAFSCTMTNFVSGCIYRSRRRVTFVSVVKAQLKRSGICANAFRSASSALVVLNGVALLPQFACKQGLRTVNWCACLHRGAAYPDRCSFICGAKGDACHCAIFYG